MIIPRFSKSASTAAAALLLFGGVQGQSAAATNNTQELSGFPACDALVAANLSHAVHFPSSPLYLSLVESSYAVDTRKQPWCFVLPSTTAEVSSTLTALRSAGGGAGDWHIAIRSGGHGGDNQNNIAKGVTIDLTHLNATTYDATTNVASVGTGARWGAVYAELEKDGVTVTGGREGVVGVGGLLLGGGISWYTARTGFACDSVVNYEVVLASGTVINANASVHSDLWRALKGGSSNFGIVTRFDLEAFPAENLNMETRIYAREHSDELIDAIADFAGLNQSMADNALISMMTYDPKVEDSTIMVVEVNTRNKANSTSYDAFNRIPLLHPPTTKSVSLVEAANSTQLSGKNRNAGAGALTIINDPRVMRYCFEQYNGIVDDMKALLGPKNFTTILDFQPLPSYFADIGVKKGGNMLGLERDSRNKILFVMGVTLLGSNSEELYPRVYQQVAAMNKRVEDFSKSIGSDNEFRYLPYADSRQNVLGSYGEANVEHIQTVAKKYDPNGFFQRRVPGGFKINRV
ncbi:FAD-dependent monooxygenase yanF [Colletotrichum siamense]|uniref:FAD-dependent monooxygenase yanF n=1 Tax=Colletotrichum siamense TaxID=690259 RepID=UPI001872477D|nr:FAD-dependent monooxygenase yanF [Colletotrichum siamense]KAF5495072.1 FAD-dependent monooxygenase yanF [Colletotrichum siamense]